MVFGIDPVVQAMILAILSYGMKALATWWVDKKEHKNEILRLRTGVGPSLFTAPLQLRATASSDIDGASRQKGNRSAPLYSASA